MLPRTYFVGPRTACLPLGPLSRLQVTDSCWVTGGYRQSLHSAMEGTMLRESLIVLSTNVVISAEPGGAEAKDAEHPPPATRVIPALQSLVLCVEM